MNTALQHFPFSVNTINSNNTVQPGPHEQLPVHLQQFIFSAVEGIVEMQLRNSPMYLVQCLSCEKAAAVLNVETDTVRQWIKGGKLPASKIGKDWSIRLVDIDKMLKLNATVVPMADKRYKKNKNRIS